MIGLTGLGRVNLLSGRIWRYRVGFGSNVNLVVRLAGPHRIRPEADFQLRNYFSFSNLFYKLQINLNSNQVLISTTSTRTIKYKSTSSHQEKYATAWMQQIIIYLNIYPYRILFFSKIRSLHFTWSGKHPLRSWSLTGNTTASAPSWARLGKWRFCECSIHSFASCRRTAKASHAASLMPPSNVHLDVEASTTWWMRWIWSVVGLL
jgi:hypothetical protein